MTTMDDPYAVELRVHLDTGLSEVITMTGRNRLHCVAKAANRWPGKVITSADLEPPAERSDDALIEQYRADAAHHAEIIERYAVRLLDEPHNEAMRAEMRVHIAARDALRQQADACDPAPLWVRPRFRAWLD